MAEIKPRYEFRIWADSLAQARKKLERMAAPKTPEADKETYLIPATTDKCNAKIRFSLMDVKALITEDRGLEQWSPVLKAGFPLDGSVIAAQIYPCLAIETPRLSRPRYSMDEFLDEVIRTEMRIAIVDVSKTRLQFSLDTCQAEFASATINHVARDTVAVESADPDAVLRLIRDLGIDGQPNTSYVREIKRILGT
jgi:exopolyphosphatase / guanosine-5'-triphosphate,3'-diphosphate pyrophosphatase